MPKRGRDDPSVKLSKTLSRVLRHRIDENGLRPVLRPDGFVPVDALLRSPGFDGVSVDQLRRCVEGSDKQRFAMRDEPDGTLLIRANQGHTVAGLDEEQLLTRMDAAAAAALGGRAVHGTYRAAWGGIVASGGLSRMARNHVHLAADLPQRDGVVSGMRASAQVHVWVDLAAAVDAGVPFFSSSNGVVLTPGDESGVLPVRFFERVVDPSQGTVWRDGEWMPDASTAAGQRALARTAAAD